MTISQANTSDVNRLPSEIWIEIFQLLDEKSLASARLTHTRWFSLGCEPSLWKRLIQQDQYRLLQPINLQFAQRDIAKYHDAVKQIETVTLEIWRRLPESSNFSSVGLYKMSASEQALCLPSEQGFTLLSTVNGEELEIEKRGKIRFFAGNYLYTLIDDTIEVKSKEKSFSIRLGQQKKIVDFSTCQDKANLLFEDRTVATIDPATETLSQPEGELPSAAFLGPDHAFCFDKSESERSYYRLSDLSAPAGTRTESSYMKILFASKDLLIAQNYRTDYIHPYMGIVYITETIVAIDIVTMKVFKSFDVPESADVKKARLINGLLFGLTYKGSLFVWDTVSEQFLRKFQLSLEPILDMEIVGAKLFLKTKDEEEVYDAHSFEVLPAPIQLRVLNPSSTAD